MSLQLEIIVVGVPIVLIVNAEERLTIVDGQLCDNGTATKGITMGGDLIPLHRNRVGGEVQRASLGNQRQYFATLEIIMVSVVKPKSKTLGGSRVVDDGDSEEEGDGGGAGDGMNE